MQYSKSWNKGADIKVITYLHNFFWKRFHYSSPTSHTIKDLLTTYFPPQDNQIKHAVINSSHVTLHLLLNKLDRINWKLRIENQKL